MTVDKLIKELETIPPKYRDEQVIILSNPDLDMHPIAMWWMDVAEGILIGFDYYRSK